jgi:predicted RNase H-like HicB family nuclease
MVEAAEARGSPEAGVSAMKTMKFTYWQDGAYYLGFWNEYPDYSTQGMSKEELVSNLKDLLADMESGEAPYIRKVEELVVAE